MKKGNWGLLVNLILKKKWMNAWMVEIIWMESCDGFLSLLFLSYGCYFLALLWFVGTEYERFMLQFQVRFI